MRTILISLCFALLGTGCSSFRGDSSPPAVRVDGSSFYRVTRDHPVETGAEPEAPEVIELSRRLIIPPPAPPEPMEEKVEKQVVSSPKMPVSPSSQSAQSAQSAQSEPSGDVQFYRIRQGGSLSPIQSAPPSIETGASRFKRVNRELLDETERLSQGLDRQALKYLKKAQEEWEEYRESEARFMADEVRGKDVQSDFAWKAREEITRNRLVRIRKILPRRIEKDGWKHLDGSLADLRSHSGGPEMFSEHVPSAIPFGFHVVKEGETLWSIAKDAYGDGSLFSRIKEANRDRISHEKKLYVGLQLVIP